MDREPLRSTPGVSHIWIGYVPDTLEVRDTFEYIGDWYDYQPDLTYKVLPKHLHKDAYKLVEGGEFVQDNDKWSVLKAKLFRYLREERTRRLTATDFLMVSDFPHPSEDIHAAWVTYRQKLRNMTATTSQDLIENNQLVVNWPTPPIWPVNVV